jgi:peptidyl-prolyl cis-trans isomerase SurA
MSMEDTKKPNKPTDNNTAKQTPNPAKPNETATTPVTTTGADSTKPAAAPANTADNTKSTNSPAAPQPKQDPAPAATPAVAAATTPPLVAEKSVTPSSTPEKPAKSDVADTPKPVVPPATPVSPSGVRGVDTQESEGSMKPLIAFIAGIITSLLLWQAYTVVTTERPRAAGEYPNPVATVNGEPISQALFEQNVEQNLVGGTARGLDIENPEVRRELETQTADILINTRLLVAAAANAGFTASDEQVSDQITRLEDQYGGAEGLDAELATLGLDRDNLLQDVSEQISVDAFLTAEVIPESITVTEEEINEVYNGLIAAGQDMPELEAVRDAIEVQIQQTKQQNLVEEYLDTLRAEADIEINL